MNASGIDLKAPFRINTNTNFGASDPSREGISFFLYHKNNITQVNNIIDFGLNGIDTLFAVEFDVNPSARGDLAADHIGIFKSNHFDHNAAGNLLTSALPQLENGNYHHVSFEWFPNATNRDSSLFRVSYNCDSIFDVYINLIDSVFLGQDTVYAGFSSQTTNGGAYGEYNLCIEYSTFTDSLRDTVLCLGDSITISSPYIGKTYTWAPATGISASNIKSPTFFPTTTTTYVLTVVDTCGDSIQDSLTINMNPVNVDITPVPGSNCARDSISLFVTVTGGFGVDYQFFWSDGYWDSTNVVTPSQTGDYIVTVQDSIGCMDIDTTTLLIDSLPNLNLGVDSTVCQGDSITLDMGTGLNYTYNWSPGGSTNQTFTFDSSLTIIGSLTDGNGCTRRDTIEFVWIALPIVDIGNDTAVCQGETVLLDAGNGGLSFLWSPGGSQNQTISVDSSFTYSVRVTNSNNCTGVDTLVLQVDTIPIIDLGNDTSLCQGDTLRLDAGPNYQNYIWAGGQQSQTAFYTSTASINVVVVDSNGCQGSDTKELRVDTIPEFSLGKDTSICELDSVLLLGPSAGMFNFYWNGDTSLTSDTLKIDTSGTYFVQFTDSNFCSGTDSIVLRVDTLPVVNLGTDTSVCDGLQLVLDAGLGYVTYTWINNASVSNLLTVDTANSYWVEVIDSNSCVGSDTIVFSIDSLPTVNLGPDTAICIDQNITFDAGANYANYQWNVGPNVRSITVDSAFTYIVNVSTQQGCPGADTIELVVNPLPIVSLGPDRQLCIGTPVNETLDAGPNFVLYEWSTGASGPEASHRTIVVNTESTFNVTVTDLNGCRNSDTIVTSAVYLPSVSIGSDTAYCEGDDFDFIMNTGSGFIRHTWRDLNLPPTNDTISRSGQILLVDTAGVYVVEIVELFNNRECVNRDTVNVVEMPLPIIGVAGTSTYCENEIFSFTLTATTDPAYSYEWSIGALTNSINVGDFGNYVVTVTNINTGCNKSETHRVVASLLPNVDLSGDSLVCEGRPIRIDAQNAGYTYRWVQVFADTSIVLSFDPVLTVADSGLYRVELDNGFCEFKDSTFVRYDIFPRVNLGENRTLCAGDTLFLNATFRDSEVQYLWNDGSRDSIYPARFSGTYIVEVSNACGVDITNITLNFENCSEIWVPNTFTPNGDGDNDFFKVYTLEDFREYRLDIVDQWGNLIYTSTDLEREWDGTSFDGREIQVGTYVWKITYQSQYEFGPEGAPTRSLVGRVNLIR